MSNRIAVLSAQWHGNLVEQAENSFIKTMEEAGFPASNIDVFKAPGSLEIPLMGKKLLEDGYDLAVGIGFIVNGGIYRHEFVAQAVVDGIVNVSLETGKPFLSVALTPITFTEGNEHHEKFFMEHMVGKGVEAANTAQSMLAFFSEQKKAA